VQQVCATALLHIGGNDIIGLGGRYYDRDCD
jgi:hypothetical protein